MNTELNNKLVSLKDLLLRTGGCAVGFSGGVDSSLLLTVACETLGEKCLAVIATSSTYSRKEYEAAVAFVKARGIPCQVIVSEELEIPKFSRNPPDRCYHCKKELFSRIKELAAARGIATVADGTNADDPGDYRPGLRAADELGIISPLRQAGLTKKDIRLISREVYHLPTADKPAMACLASRFPYGSTITEAKLRQVEAMEDFLEQKGVQHYRARHHGNLLRLEISAEKIPEFLPPKVRSEIVAFAKKLGFTYITLDLEGYRTGSMNEVLD